MYTVLQFINFCGLMLPNGWFCVSVELALLREQQSVSFLWVIPSHYEEGHFKIENFYPAWFVI